MSKYLRSTRLQNIQHMKVRIKDKGMLPCFWPTCESDYHATPDY